MRGLSLVVSSAVACLVLAWGLFHMHGIFLDERADALAGIASRKRTLEQYAQSELQQRLRNRLQGAQPTIDAAATDPLLPGNDVLLVDRGKQLLPRTRGNKPGDDNLAADLLSTLLSEQPERAADKAQADDPDSPWAQRVALYVTLQRSLLAGDRAGAEQGVRTILSERARFVVAARKDLPLTIAMLARLNKSAAPRQAFMTSMLRDGLSAGPSRIEGLQRSLLRNRHRFSDTDMQRLGAEITSLSETYRVLFSDFAERLKEKPAATVALPPTSLDGASLISDKDGAGQWYLGPPRNERIRGMRIDLSTTLGEISATMRERALIAPEDEVTGPSLPAVQRLTDLALTVQSPNWQPAIDAVQSRYRLKAFLEVSIALLCFGLMGAAWLVYRRKQRFLELKGEFVSAVSHELRTPLASIRLMAETLERKTEGLPQVRDYPKRIVRDVDGLSVLVENILSFNRLSRGRWEPRLDTVSLAEVVAKLDEERDGWARGNAQLEVADLSGVSLRADRELLQLLLINLLRNACSYNERDPKKLWVSAQQDGGWRVLVKDNGSGIPPEQQERVFDDFYRAQQGGVRGSGLGLALCRKIMRAHGGSITIAESSPAGSTFALHFPA